MFDECEAEFQELIENPDAFIDELREYPAVFSPDLSLYRNAPLSAQITNVYDSRPHRGCWASPSPSSSLSS